MFSSTINAQATFAKKLHLKHINIDTEMILDQTTLLIRGYHCELDIFIFTSKVTKKYAFLFTVKTLYSMQYLSFLKKFWEAS